MATSDSTASLHSLINRMHTFREVVHLTPPNKQARRDVGFLSAPPVFFSQ